MKRALKWIGITLGTLLALLIAALLTVWYRPGLVLNETTLAYGAKYLPQIGYHAEWDHAALDFGIDGFWKRSLKLGFDGLCVRAIDGSMDACIGKFEATVAGDLMGFKPRLTELGPIAVLGGRVNLEPGKVAEKKDEPASDPDGEIRPTWLQSAHLNPVNLEIDAWKLVLEEQTITGALKLSNARSDSGWRWLLDAHEAMTIGELAHTAEAGMEIAMDGERWWIPRDGSIDGKARFKDGRRAELRATLGERNKKDEHDYRVRATWTDHGKIASAKLEGKVSPTGIRGVLDASARGYSPKVPRVTVSDCDFSMQRLPGERELSQTDLDCAVIARVIFPPVEGIPQFKVPTETKGRVKADLRSSFPPSADQPLIGNVRLDVSPILTPLFEGKGFAAAELAGIPTEFPNDWKLDTQVDFRMVIPQFQKTVAELKKTRWAVPAPLNVLDGRIELGANGRVDLASAKLPLFMKTRLNSPHQRLDLDGAGEFSFVRATEDGDSGASSVAFDLTLSSVRLALPRLDLESPPRFFPDSRIKAAENEKAGMTPPADESSFVYRFNIRTPPDQPLEIISNLAKTPVPIHIHLAMENGKEPGGSLRITDFPLELFRRNASVERFVLRLDPVTGKQNVDGSIRVAYTDYVVRILVFGPSDEPRIKLTSDPPVPEDQLMAVLLFGKELDQLDPEESESVGATRSAVYNNAIGLASLYFLASTPVESVGYDPATGAFNAKLKLGAGTSLNVGQRAGDEGEENAGFVGVRKRLSRFWTVTTDVAHSSSTTGSGSTASAFLDWSNRY